MRAILRPRRIVTPGADRAAWQRAWDALDEIERLARRDVSPACPGGGGAVTDAALRSRKMLVEEIEER